VDAYGDTLLLPRPSLGVVQLFDLDGEPRGPLGQVGLYGTSPRHVAFPRAAAMDDQGNVMILDQRRMMFVLWDPVKNICLDEFYGVGMHPGGLYAPDDMAIDAAGRVYVTQTREGRVQVYEGGRPAAQPAKTAAE
jgi:hypothetical protein